jgi:hypothetical protein
VTAGEHDVVAERVREQFRDRSVEADGHLGAAAPLARADPPATATSTDRGNTAGSGEVSIVLAPAATPRSRGTIARRPVPSQAVRKS